MNYLQNRPTMLTDQVKEYLLPNLFNAAVRASFVLYPKDQGVYISARSLGEVNVQVIVEALGGGGNSTTAGGQLNTPNIAVARTALLRAIDEYFEK